MNQKPILVICPMDCEYTTIKDALADRTIHHFGMYEYSEGYYKNIPVVALKTLVGAVNSAVSTAHCIKEYDPLCVIIQGTAGAHDPDLKVNDIILGENILNAGCYFSPHRDFGMGSDPTQWNFAGTETLTETGDSLWLNTYHSTECLLKIAETTEYQNGKIRRGTLYSADAWNRELDMIQYFNTSYHTDCEEMECFPVAHVCQMFGIDYLGIRVISNSEHHPECEFSPESGRVCQLYCLDVIENIAKSMTEL